MGKIDNSTLAGKLEGKFPQTVLRTDELSDMLNVYADRRSNVEIVKYLWDEPSFQFQFLTDICGVHYPDRKGEELEVVYHLHSFVNNHRIRLKFSLPIEDPTIKTLTDLYAGANWMERETFDFYGIIFEGHPNLKRILNVDEMDVFPMRKEHPLEDPNRIDKQDKFFGR
ncbi:MAG: NADH-quinone oxidoreductase subunit C [Opitutaceae bacterium]|nr:NADH-quinone oxidoreductase subunit C [Cytophagales bacterium]